MSEVAKVRTPLSESDVARVLLRAYGQAFSASPTLELLAGAWAQIALENAHGGAIWNNNFGNITTLGQGVDFYTIQTDEQISPGVWEPRVLKYRAHETPEEGAVAYWQLLADHYAPAAELFALGRMRDATFKLHDLGYFTANPGPIAVTMQQLYDYFLAKVAPQLGNEKPQSSTGDGGGVLILCLYFVAKAFGWV